MTAARPASLHRWCSGDMPCTGSAGLADARRDERRRADDTDDTEHRRRAPVPRPATIAERRWLEDSLQARRHPHRWQQVRLHRAHRRHDAALAVAGPRRTGSSARSAPQQSQAGRRGQPIRATANRVRAWCRRTLASATGRGRTTAHLSNASARRRAHDPASRPVPTRSRRRVRRLLRTQGIPRDTSQACSSRRHTSTSPTRASPASAADVDEMPRDGRQAHHSTSGQSPVITAAAAAPSNNALACVSVP